MNLSKANEVKSKYLHTYEVQCLTWTFKVLFRDILCLRRDVSATRGHVSEGTSPAAQQEHSLAIASPVCLTGI